jgi:hypothetical protein
VRAIYKYMKREHVECVLNAHTFKIGTLYEYRAEEVLGPEIGDREEGVQRSILAPSVPTSFDLNDDTPEAAHYRQLIRGAPGVTVKINLSPGSNGILHHQADNRFLFCYASEFDEAAMHQMGYDACIEITRPARFFGFLTAGLRTCLGMSSHTLAFEGMCPIRYCGRDTNYLETVVPHLIKEERYAHQREWRAVWGSTDPIRVPSLFIASPQAAALCRRRV